MFQKITMINYSRPLSERAKARKSVGPYTWTPTPPNSGRGFYQASKGFRMDPRGSTLDLRIEECAATSRGTTGYYCDRFGDCTMTPIVARLPRSRGFLIGWTMGRGMCASLEPQIYDDAEDACRAAHSVAENAAERERDYQEQHRDGEDGEDGDGERLDGADE